MNFPLNGCLAFAIIIGQAENRSTAALKARATTTAKSWCDEVRGSLGGRWRIQRNLETFVTLEIFQLMFHISRNQPHEVMLPDACAIVMPDLGAGEFQADHTRSIQKTDLLAKRDLAINSAGAVSHLNSECSLPWAVNRVEVNPALPPQRTRATPDSDRDR